MKFPVDDTVKEKLNQHLADLEQTLQADVLAFYGAILDGIEETFREIVEQLYADGKHQTLYIALKTPGGSPFAVERLVSIVRHHYHEVNFIVPDYAYSAGTIFCMSGDNIFMDYFSVLGPIDPQIITKDGRMVPALGHLDKVNELLDKSRKNTLTAAEFIILKEFDLAELRQYEQARELTIDQLKKMAGIQYKFKNWKKHTSSGKDVTRKEKLKRAEAIAQLLSDTDKWKAHARPINMLSLREIGLKIEDYGSEEHAAKNHVIREYHRLLADYAQKNNGSLPKSMGNQCYFCGRV